MGEWVLSWGLGVWKAGLPGNFLSVLGVLSMTWLGVSHRMGDSEVSRSWFEVGIGTLVLCQGTIQMTDLRLLGAPKIHSVPG